MINKSIYVNSYLCTGCKACQTACKVLNELHIEEKFSANNYGSPAGLSSESWIFVDSDDGGLFSPRMCSHCSDAECIKACPEHAIAKYANWVVVDPKKCIGCGSCESKCPYGAIHVRKNTENNSKTGIAQKCDGCISKGLNSPLCVSSCSAGALVYGNRLKIIKDAKKQCDELNLNKKRAVISGIDEYSGLNVITIDNKVLQKRNGFSLNGETHGVAKLLYSLLAPLSFGFPFLKNKIWDFSKAVSLEDIKRDKKNI